MIELKVKSLKFPARTRAQRKAAVAIIIRQLMQIREAEIGCLLNMPCNLSASSNYYSGESAVESLSHALDFLSDAYTQHTYMPSECEMPF